MEEDLLKNHCCFEFLKLKLKDINLERAEPSCLFNTLLCIGAHCTMHREKIIVLFVAEN